jgi:hypothetical protein
MPSGDRTGPAGIGPMTGRAAGFCAGYPVPGYMNPYGRRGFFRQGRGRGYGRRNWFYNTPPIAPAGGFTPYYGPPPTATDRADELQILKIQAEDLKNTLLQIDERINQLQQNDNEE